MATTLLPSPDLKSTFSPYTDSPASPAPVPPFPFAAAYRSMQRASLGSEKGSLQPPPSPYPATVDPSPVESHTSNSTEHTDFEDVDGEDVQPPDDDGEATPDIEVLSPNEDTLMRGLKSPTLGLIDTSVAGRLRSGSSDDAPASVIHAPAGFKQFGSDAKFGQSATQSPPNKTSPPAASTISRTHSISTRSVKSEATVVSPDIFPPVNTKRWSRETAPINTQVPPTTRHGAGSTPRASTQQEADEEWRRRSSMRSSSSNQSHENIYELDEDHQSLTDVLRSLDVNAAEREIDKLQSALSECWSLCNTLAGLSSSHRERMFTFSGSGNVQEAAWRSCWRLCQKLYESRNEDAADHIKETLELCREFCQALFEARFRGDEVTDSILRVSFELNNHLYNTHDRNLPDAFRERTLDFYLTMCHRLMKQRTSLPEETDSLLRSCWSLAELLFSLRQNSRDKKPVDEELLGSAVQACWELCDLFREGWNQVRPERGTPRPTQRGFPMFSARHESDQRSMASSHHSRPASALSSKNNFNQLRPMTPMMPPETPTTIFDDRDELSPSDSESQHVPNILVLGPENPMGPLPSVASSAASVSQRSGYSGHRRWPSGGSIGENSSAFSDRTATSINSRNVDMSNFKPTSEQEPHLIRLKALVVKAANNLGFARQPQTTMPTFVKTLSPTAFGNQTWQLRLLDSYKKLVVSDPTLRDRSSLPVGRQFTAHEIARAVMWMGNSEQFSWFKDLFRLVFGFPVEEAAVKNVMFNT